MKPSLLTMTCALLAAVIVTPITAQIQAAPIYADTIYTGGDIVTVNELRPKAEAVAVRGGRIAAVGYRDEVMKLRGPGGEKNWRCELTFPQKTVNQMVKKVYDLGVPLNLHSNGDGAIDAFLKAHESAAAGDLPRDRHVTMIHAQFTRKDQLDKYVEYKITPSFYTLHTYYFAEAHIKNRGKEQAMYLSPMRDALDKGLRPTNHTNFVVAPLDQMFMLWSAVNRVSRAGAEIGSDQRVTPLEGLKAMTINVAYQYGEQGSKGSLEPGKLADLVVLSANPLTVKPDAIRDIKVVETIKEGKTVYRRDSAGKRAAVPSNCADSDACFKMASHVLNDAGVIDVHLHGN